MDAIELDDIERARRMTPSERLRAAIEVSELAFRLRHAALRNELRGQPEEEIERAFLRWLARDE